MFRAIWCFLLVPLFGYTGFFDWTVPLSAKAERAKSTLEDLGPKIEHALQEHNVPGIAVGIVVDGHVVWEKGFGFRDLEAKTVVSGDTVFPIGSCTKAFTSLAVGMLVKQGHISWDTRMIDIMPEFRLKDTHATHNATLRDLLSHRTGLSRHDFMIYNSSDTREGIVHRMRYLEPLYSFRERYCYNSVGYVAVGLALERVAGKTWENFVSTELFKPLQMHSTSTTIEELQSFSDIAYPYMEREGKLKKVPYRSFSNVGPTASINSSVHDMNHWMQMLLGKGMYNGKQIVHPATIQETQSSQIVSTGYPENDAVISYSYGFGWDISSYRGHYCVGHDGGVDGFTSAILLLPAENVGVVVLANRSMTGIAQMVAREALDRMVGAPTLDVWFQYGANALAKGKTAAVQDTFQSNGLPSHELHHYVGRYQNPGYGALFIEENGGKLHAVYNGITYVLGHKHYDIFEIIDELQEIIFSRKKEKLIFQHNIYGEIEEVAFRLDVSSSPIVFKRDSQEKTLSYFRQFTGTYRYGETLIDIVLDKQRLYAKSPGWPDYELLPFGDNEFQIKEKAGYLVRFPKNAFGELNEAHLVPPFGGTFVAAKNPS